MHKIILRYVDEAFLGSGNWRVGNGFGDCKCGTGPKLGHSGVNWMEIGHLFKTGLELEARLISGRLAVRLSLFVYKL